MKHKIKKRKINRTSSHRMALLSNMSCSLIMHERISTTLIKAKILRSFVEKLITKSKNDSLNIKRLLLSRLKNQNAVEKLISQIGKRYTTRPGGYTRIIKNNYRLGDNAEMAIIELV
jgi:large subunit ribosomal protein L17